MTSGTFKIDVGQCGAHRDETRAREEAGGSPEHAAAADTTSTFVVRCAMSRRHGRCSRREVRATEGAREGAERRRLDAQREDHGHGAEHHHSADVAGGGATALGVYGGDGGGVQVLSRGCDWISMQSYAFPMIRRATPAAPRVARSRESPREVQAYLTERCTQVASA